MKQFVFRGSGAESMLTLKFTVYILVVLLCYNHHNFSTFSPFGYFHRFENLKLFYDQKGFQRFPPKFQVKSLIRKKELNIGKKNLQESCFYWPDCPSCFLLQMRANEILASNFDSEDL